MGTEFLSFTTAPMEWVKGKPVGSGSFGIVHLAMNKATGELFVVKSAESGAGLQSLENEANILQSLNSPYIVRCLGRDFSYEANGERKLNLFMEYMGGGSLSDVAEKFGGALDETVIRLYTREILKGLKYLHGGGIVHCDLKCKNVLLGSSGNITLADFGCAKRLTGSKSVGVSSHSRHSICGTPLWMAPEVLRNEGLDFASDIWSLGCTIIEMATGRPPWSDELSNPMSAVLKITHSNDTPQFPTKFPKEGLDFLAKCLQRNPKMRWTTEELLDHPFVSGNSAGKSLRKEDACSPASVLDVETCEEEELPSKIPFSRKCWGEKKRATTRREQTERELVSLENWITVRSGVQGFLGECKFGHGF